MQYTLRTLQHVIVPEPQHTIAVPLQVAITLGISLRLHTVAMLSAIQLNHETLRVTCKINEIGTNRCLTAKM